MAISMMTLLRREKGDGECESRSRGQAEPSPGGRRLPLEKALSGTECLFALGGWGKTAHDRVLFSLLAAYGSDFAFGARG
jgi:hypothetical protein